jgi:uncharacterized protein YegJ (DUF2314 family)
MKPVLIVLGIIVVAVVVFVLRRISRRASSGERDLTALVFLLNEPRQLADWQVRQAAARALGAELAISDKPEPNTILPVAAEKVNPALPPGAGMTYFVNTGSRMFLINSFAQPYMGNPEEFAERIVDQRLRRAVATHRAWISADLYGETPSPSERPEIYRVLGLMLAPLAADDCLAIYCPELERCNEFAPSVVEALHAGRPLELFENPTHAPIVNVDADDPKMVAAVEEARRRWPEFIAAFQVRADPESPCVVKACFTDGEQSEFMWVSVQRIDGDQITGRLENSPASLTNVKEGDTVTVSLNDLNDWLCEIDGETVGGFTMKVMADKLNSQS